LSGTIVLPKLSIFCSSYKPYTLCEGHKAVTGSDATGTYSGTVFSYMAGQNKLEAQILVYNEGEFVRFTQVS